MEKSNSNLQQSTEKNTPFLNELKDLQNNLEALSISQTINDKDRQKFIKKYLGENFLSLNEESNGLIDKYINERISIMKDVGESKKNQEDIIKGILLDFKDDTLEEIKDKLGITEEETISLETIGSKIPKEVENEQLPELKEIISKEAVDETKKNEEVESKKVDTEKYSQYLNNYEVENNATWNIEHIKPENTEEVENKKVDTEKYSQYLNNYEVENNATWNIEHVKPENTEEVKSHKKTEKVNTKEIKESKEKKESKEYIVKKGDNLWDIIKDNFQLTSNREILKKLKEIISIQEEGELKDKLKKYKGDLIHPGDKIKLK